MAMICTVTQTWNTDRPFFLFGDIWRVWVCVCILVAACDHWQSLFNTLPVCIREWLTQRIQCLRTHAHSGMCGRDCVVFCSPHLSPEERLWWSSCCVCVCVCDCVRASTQEECQLLSRAQWRRRGICWPSATVQLAAIWRLIATPPTTSWPPSKNRYCVYFPFRLC